MISVKQRKTLFRWMNNWFLVTNLLTHNVTITFKNAITYNENSTNALILIRLNICLLNYHILINFITRDENLPTWWDFKPVTSSSVFMRIFKLINVIEKKSNEKSHTFRFGRGFFFFFFEDVCSILLNETMNIRFRYLDGCIKKVQVTIVSIL